MEAAQGERMRSSTVGPRARPGVDEPFAGYRLGAAWDEMFATDGAPRGHAAALYETSTTLPADELVRRQQACELSFLHQGITFTVYGHEEATEKIIPTDLLPRIVPGAEWRVTPPQAPMQRDDFLRVVRPLSKSIERADDAQIAAQQQQ